MAKRSPRNGTE
ncbi:hypothetical protein D030_0838A, partial [Vibrio parahaemolyticus AQ3810]